MDVEWTDDLLTGDSLIDGQHKAIFEAVNRMLRACQEGKGRESVSDTIAFLERYVSEHFAAEEKLHKDNAYPALAAHKAEHDEFMQTFGKLKAAFDEDGPTLPVIVVMNRTIVTWLINHIKRTDMAFSDYLRKHG